MEYLELITFLGKLANAGIQLVSEKQKLIAEAPENVQSLKEKLQFIQRSRLKDYDVHFMEDSTTKLYLTHISNLAREAKDIIDTFDTQNTQQYQRTAANRVLHALPHGQKLIRISERVNDITKKMEEIDGYYTKYCKRLSFPVANPGNNSEWLEKQRREVEENNVEGFDVPIRLVSDMLLTKTPTRRVISIVGTTGSGKTTLAKKIYNGIIPHFKHHAWVFVPSNYTMRDVLLGIIRGVGEGTSKGSGKTTLAKIFWDVLYLSRIFGEEMSKLELLDDEKLVEKVRRLLQNKKYLVVLDGVEETQLWETLEKDKVFPDDDKHGSRLLLTTRSKSVASLASSSTNYQFHMEPLDERARWQLLENLVFKDGTCPPQLKNVGKQIDSKCAGLPLAIVSLASLLAKDRRVNTWRDILANLRLYLNRQGSPPCFGLFRLTCNTMSPQLQKCLLYLGVFPSGFEIPASQVISLWIAEELIEETGGSSAEETAWRYLEELNNRSLIQVVRKRSDGGVRTFQIHELWTEFCVSISEGEFQVHTKPGSDPRNTESGRLSIQYDLRCIWSNPDYLNLRTLLCFHDKDDLDSKGLKLEFHRFPKLRVLDVGPTPVSKIHKKTKHSSLLKYLRIKHTSLKRLPSSICSLPNLQTLDIKNTRVLVPCLPATIWGMVNLRHLLLPPQTTLPKCPYPSGESLQHLQTLSAITPDENTEDLFSGSRFPSLIKLTLNSRDKVKTNRCLSGLCKLNFLQKLKITDPVTFPSIPTTLPASLIKVTLVNTDLVADVVMRMLENLDHLQVLKLLKGSVRGPKLEMRPNTFPQLRFLFMEEIGVRTWTMGDGAMRSLEELTITRCHQLELLPQQIGELHNKLRIKVNSPSDCFRGQLQQLSLQRSDFQVYV